MFETKQQAKTRRNREAILDAAMFITKQYGADALTVKNICETANVSNGSFYHLFPSKDDLVYYFLTYAFARYCETNPEDAQDMPQAQRILSLYGAYIDVCQEAGYEFVSLVYTTSNKSLNFRERPKGQSIILGRIADCLKAGVEGGEFAPELDLDAALLSIASIVTGAMFYWCVFKGRDMDLKTQVLSLLDTYLDSIGA